LQGKPDQPVVHPLQRCYHAVLRERIPPVVPKASQSVNVASVTGLGGYYEVQPS
jgi:hypothetical protein